MLQPLGAGYVLDDLIGRGATGDGWRGHAREDGRVVLGDLKVLRLPGDVPQDPGFVATEKPTR